MKGDQLDKTSVVDYLRHLFRGIRVIAKWEFMQNVKTVRMLVLILIFSLVMLGGSYGITTLFSNPPGEITFKIPEEVIESAMNEVFISAHVLNRDGGNYSNDLIIYTYYGSGEPAPKTKFRVFEIWGLEIDDLVNLTNTNGIYDKYRNLAPDEYQAELDPPTSHSAFKIANDADNVTALSIATSPIFDLELGEITLGEDTDLSSLVSRYRQVGIIVHVVDPSGIVSPNATIYVSGEQVGKTNENGTLAIDLDPGDYTIKASFQGSYSNLMNFSVDEPPEIEKDDTSFGGLPAHLGPDFVIIIVASIAAFIASLSAIVLSFDAITKERAERSMDVLLTKPFPRESVVLGKYIGITGAMIAPFAVVMFASVWIISAVSDKWPSASVVITFLVFMILLISVYIALEILISILSKTTGTAILAGIGIWVLLNMLWGVLGLGIAELFDLDIVSVSNYMSFMNPTDLFLVCLTIVSTDALITSMGLEEVKESINIEYAFSNWVFFFGFFLWVILSIGIATFVFKKKEDL